MKIAGKKIEGPNEEILVLPRPDEDIVFRARAVLDMSPFESRLKRPEPPVVRRRDNSTFLDENDPTYIQRLNDYAEKRIAYMLVKSLEATQDLEWETVNLNDPDTWLNYRSELMSSGFSDIEVNRIINTVMAANCLSQQRLDEARASFLATQRGASRTESSQDTERNGTPSGAPANAS